MSKIPIGGGKNKLEINNIKRHDYKTQTLINISKKYKDVKDFKLSNF